MLGVIKASAQQTEQEQKICSWTETGQSGGRGREMDVNRISATLDNAKLSTMICGKWEVHPATDRFHQKARQSASSSLFCLLP